MPICDYSEVIAAGLHITLNIIEGISSVAHVNESARPSRSLNLQEGRGLPAGLVNCLGRTVS